MKLQEYSHSCFSSLTFISTVHASKYGTFIGLNDGSPCLLLTLFESFILTVGDEASHRPPTPFAPPTPRLQYSHERIKALWVKAARSGLKR